MLNKSFSFATIKNHLLDN